MDVIGDQRIGKAGGVRFGNDGGKPVNKICTVGVRPQNLPTFDSAEYDMVPSSGVSILAFRA